MTREEIETALDVGRLQAAGIKNKWYDVRRNGKTLTWKRDPARYSIPVKVGLKDCFRIERDYPECYLRVRPENFDPKRREI